MTVLMVMHDGELLLRAVVLKQSVSEGKNNGNLFL